MTRRAAVFVDRDDTLMRDVPYCSRPEDVTLLPAAAQAVRRWNEAGLPVFLVTNQSGLARGYFDRPTLERVHERLRELLGKEGARLDALYVCPHAPADACPCRKPEPGMVEQAAREHGIDPRQSVVVGDRMLDVLLAKRVGARAVIVPSERGRAELALAGPQEQPDFVAPSLAEAAEWVLRRR